MPAPTYVYSLRGPDYQLKNPICGSYTCCSQTPKHTHKVPK